MMKRFLLHLSDSVHDERNGHSYEANKVSMPFLAEDYEQASIFEQRMRELLGYDYSAVNEDDDDDR